MRNNVIPLHASIPIDDAAEKPTSPYLKAIAEILELEPTTNRDLVSMLDVALEGMDAGFNDEEVEVALVRRVRDYLAGSGIAPAA